MHRIIKYKTILNKIKILINSFYIKRLTKPKNEQSQNFTTMMLRHVREAKGLPQAHLAQMSGLTKVTISNIETGKTLPNTATREKISRALNDPNIDWYKTYLCGMLPLHYLDETPEERVARAVYHYFESAKKSGQESIDFKIYFDQVRFIDELLRIMPGLLNYGIDPKETKRKTDEFLKANKV